MLVVAMCFFCLTQVLADERITWQFLDDANSQFSATEVINTFDKLGQAEEIKGLSRGFTISTSWLLAEVPQISEPLFVNIGPGYLNSVLVYGVYGAEPKVLFDSFQDSQQLMPAFTFELPIGTQRPDKLLVRLATSSSHLLNGYWMNVEEFEHFQHESAIKIGAYQAIVITIALIFLVLGARTGKAMYVFYALYLSAVAVITLFQQGYGSWLSIDGWRVSSHLVGVAAGISYVMAGLFLRIFFELEKHQAPFSYWLNTLLIVWGLVTAVFAWSNWYIYVMPISFLFGYLQMGSAVVLAYQAMTKHGKVEGRIFFLAFGQACITLIITMLTLKQWIPYTQFGVEIYYVGVLMQAVLLLIGFTERFIFAEKKALLAAESSEFKAVAIAGEMTHEVFEASEKLKASLKRESEIRQSHEHFINTINHEYRTPLAIIKGNLDMLKFKQPDLEHRFKKIDIAMERLRQLFDRTLANYQHLYSSEVHFETVEAIQFIKDTVNSSLVSKPVKAFYPAHPIEINTDSDLLRTAMINVLINADKYFFTEDSQSHISLGLSDNEDLISIRISNPYDPSIAIPFSTLFQPYVRGGHQSNTGGLGFGLYLVKTNIEKIGGTIRIVPSQSYQFTVLIELPKG
jgi:signal transduction histidine kinase